MKLNIFLSLSVPFILISALNKPVSGQNQMPLSPDVYDSWNSIDRPGLSRDGKIVFFEQNPQYGDGSLILYYPEKQSYDTISRGYGAAVPVSGSFTAWKIKPPLKDTRQAKLDGKKKDDFPKDSLGILSRNGNKFLFPGLKSFSVAAKGGEAMFALIDKPIPAADTAKHDSLAPEKGKELKKEKPAKKKDETKTYLLNIVYPADSVILSRENVTDAVISEQGGTILYATLSSDSIPVSAVFAFNTVTRTETPIFSAPGHILSPAADNLGRQFAFLYSSDTIKARRYSLHYYQKEAKRIADTADAAFPAGFSAGEHGSIYFSDDGSKLYFGIAPTPRPEAKDTLTDDEKARVDVWHWRDPLLQPQQLKQLDEEKKRTYLTVYHTNTGKIVPLANELMRTVITGFKGNGRVALGFADEHYLVETSWQGRRFRDVYLINNETGETELLLKKVAGQISLGTTGKYIAWYSETDSLWMTMILKNKKITRHSAGREIAFYDEEYDMPGLPYPVGNAGWLKNDRLFVVYDRFDLWGLDPDGKKPPVCLTMGEGRTTKRQFRYLNLDREVPYLENEEGSLLLSSFNTDNKDAGFWQLGRKFPEKPEKLLEGPYKYSTPVKAADADQLLFSRSTFAEFPDLWLSNSRFSPAVKISDANPQQKNYLWGSVEIISWRTPSGKMQKGLFYKPKGYDPEKKKYPALVYFYEKYTDQLHQYYPPKPSRSIISPTYCTSNGYVVFIPDIDYTDGHPGQNAYESVVSGVTELISRRLIDNEHIGVQGQSWGGYQVAWLITRTNLFKAAMAGAPVSNMTSAYGGIRWESGMVRQFQYEEGQSRIGATLWERPDLYIENSALFSADKIETPLLIMSNDTDGAVPWYQGIELFTALRRLQKPCWLLNYNGDEHNLTKRGNMKDLDIRMMQFFDHYLKGAPVPEWMEKGIRATDKGKKSGY